MRTQDWVCQWCGYPLLSKSYKVVPKTFKQLQQERQSRPTESNPEEEINLEGKPEPPPNPQQPHTPEQIETPPPAPEISAPLPMPKAVIETERAARPEPEPAVVEVPETEPIPVVPPESEQEPIILPPPQPAEPPAPEEPIITPPPEPAPAEPHVAEPATEKPPVGEPVPTPVPEPPAPTNPPAPAETDANPKELLDRLNNPGEIQLTMDEVNAVYQADRSTAHSSLTGKILIITGIVEKKFIRDHLDVRYILLTGSKKPSMWTVRCVFEKENLSRFQSLTEGQTATIKGQYDGYSKNIILKNCSVV
jgi:hypothetical protein